MKRLQKKYSGNCNRETRNRERETGKHEFTHNAYFNFLVYVFLKIKPSTSRKDLFMNV